MPKTLIALAIAGFVLGYGYWHSATHASFHVRLDVVDAAGGKTKDLPGAEVTFKDSEGRVLARGISDERYNYVHLIHPEAGDCHEAEKSAATSQAGRNAWQECFGRLSTWIPTWADAVRMVDLQTERCRWSDIPVSVSKSNADWFLWWVPLPHVGGKPYGYYSLTISADENHCYN